MKLSVCIATYERPECVEAALRSLAAQRRRPDEIVVSDASVRRTAEDAVAAFCRDVPEIVSRRVTTDRKILPWQRWWAFSHTTGDVVLFMDDDVTLAPNALARIEEAYEKNGQHAAGIGIPMTVAGTEPLTDGSVPFRLRWLGTDGFAPGSVTPGGLTVALPIPRDGGGIVPVQWLCGGAMSFPRSVMEKIGPLHNLCDLYDRGVGKGEDGVTSHRALAYGPLLAIAEPLAFHPRAEHAHRTANPQDGFTRGVLETWGRAHTLRWLATDAGSWRRAWIRQISLEFGRSVVWLARAPWRRIRWSRLAGDIAGASRAILRWRSIPDVP